MVDYDLVELHTKLAMLYNPHCHFGFNLPDKKIEKMIIQYEKIIMDLIKFKEQGWEEKFSANNGEKKMIKDLETCPKCKGNDVDIYDTDIGKRSIIANCACLDEECGYEWDCTLELTIVDGKRIAVLAEIEY